MVWNSGMGSRPSPREKFRISRNSSFEKASGETHSGQLSHWMLFSTSQTTVS